MLTGATSMAVELQYLRDQLAASQAREAELIADNARLREALIGYHSVASGVLGVPSIAECAKKASSALAATPAQSLARVRNQVRDECYNALQKVMVTDHSLRTYKRCLDAIRAMKEPT